jgi:3-hydroxymyristoyl/3-hydroxydecanoyl-(acyl carrier protein) dehydratase
METEKEWKLADSEDVFQGHFPGNAILPGVLIISFANQTLAQHLGEDLYVSNIIKQKFLKPVIPNCALNISILGHKKTELGYKVSYIATIDKATVAKGTIICKTTSSTSPAPTLGCNVSQPI